MLRPESRRTPRSLIVGLLVGFTFSLGACAKNEHRVSGDAGSDCPVVTGQWTFDLVDGSGTTVISMQNAQAKQVGCNIRFEMNLRTLVGGLTGNSGLFTLTGFGIDLEVEGSFLPLSGNDTFVESTSFTGTWGGTIDDVRTGGLMLGRRL
ncbi:MAG: hypothetical protein KDC98_07415 [Planctomycetes bacterium]|nr:hypothetical protein [Planctomycetota bacterium]